jgi:anti-sigma factor RsiW
MRVEKAEYVKAGAEQRDRLVETLAAVGNLDADTEKRLVEQEAKREAEKKKWVAQDLQLQVRVAFLVAACVPVAL